MIVNVSLESYGEIKEQVLKKKIFDVKEKIISPESNSKLAQLELLGFDRKITEKYLKGKENIPMFQLIPSLVKHIAS